MTTAICCSPKRFPVAGNWKLRHTCIEKKGQPYGDADRRAAVRRVELHRIETAATGLELAPVLKGGSVREHFDRCNLGDQCDLCAYLWDHLDDADDPVGAS